MIKISILYPKEENSWFDMDCYLKKHLPVTVKHFCGQQGFRGISVERGLENIYGGSGPIYSALCHILFDSFENFTEAYNSHEIIIRDDLLNYTNVKPIIQISERVKLIEGQ